MSDTDVKIEVETTGSDDAAKKLDDLAKKQDAATEATKRNTEAAKENAKAQQDAAEAQQQAAEAASENAQAQQEASGANSDAADTADKAHKALESLAKGAEAGGKTVSVFGTSIKALSALMKGDFVGAAKLAKDAVLAFGQVFIANPWLAIIAATTAAVVALTKRIKDANAELRGLQDELSGKGHDLAIKEAKRWKERKGPIDYSKFTDEELDERIEGMQEAYDEQVKRTRGLASKGYALSQDKSGNKDDAKRRMYELEVIDTNYDLSVKGEDEIKGYLDALKKEREKRKTAAEDAAKQAADKQADAENLASSEKAFTRRQQADAVEEKYGKAMRMQFEKQGLQQDYANETDDEKRLEIREKIYELERKISQKNESQAKAQRDLERAQTASTAEKEFGKEFSLGLQKSWIEEDLAAATTDEERVKLATKLLQINEQIANEKERQAKADEQEAAREQRQAEQEQRKADAQAKKVQAEKEAQADWKRGRKLDKMSGEDRVSYINNEIAALRQQPATIENRQKMRKLIDERDAAQKNADAFKEKKNDFLHRNDTDAQRMASIGKQLAEAGVSGDQAKMLELMMAGEDIAENYQEPLTKRQQRRAEKKAERDARAAMRAAKAMRKQIAGVEAAWGAGDKSAAEQVAGMHTDAQGNTYAMKMNDNGKMVKVEGQNLTNDLLKAIKDALT